jgi:hypothetical protein
VAAIFEREKKFGVLRATAGRRHRLDPLVQVLWNANLKPDNRVLLFLFDCHGATIVLAQGMSRALSQKPVVPVSFRSAMAERGAVDTARGERIERLMTRQGWQTNSLARVMRVHRNRISDWKAGRPISSDALERLAVALETTRFYIETGQGDAHYPRGLPPALLLKQLADALGLDDADA